MKSVVMWFYSTELLNFCIFLVDAAWMNAQYYLRSHPQFNNLEQLSQLGIPFLTTVHVGITVLATAITASCDNILRNIYILGCFTPIYILGKMFCVNTCINEDTYV